MTDKEPADWVIRVPDARSVPITNSNQPRLSQAQMDAFNSWGTNLAGKDGLASGSVPVAGSAVSGTVQGNNVGVAPATSVAVTDTNMLVSQDFASATTVVAAGQWSWDGDDGHLTKGCARVDCNGSQDDLVSNEVLVVPGENVEVTVWVKWAGISYTGTNPIVLGIEKYRKGRDPDTGGTTYLDVGGATIATLSSPAASGGWTKLTGTYVVPDKGVDQLRFRFSAATTITAGLVRWDEAVFSKTDLIPDAAVPGVGTTVDNIVTSLSGTTGTGFTHADSAATLAATSAAITATSATVSTLDAAGSSGSIAGDDFTNTGELVSSPNWGGSYSTGNGTYVADGNDAVWTPIGAVANVTVDAKLDWQGTDATSVSDHQKIQVVLNSTIYYDTWISNRYSSLCLYGRVSADWASYIKLQINSDGTWKLINAVAGVETMMTSGTTSAPVGGSTVTLYCGDTSTVRKFTATINGVAFCSYIEGGTTSLYGASNRKWGFGGIALGTPAASYFVPGGVRNVPVGYWCTPPKINQWIGVDQ